MSGEKEPVVIGGYRAARRLDVAGSAETYQATGPGGEVVVLRRGSGRLSPSVRIDTVWFDVSTDGIRAGLSI